MDFKKISLFFLLNFALASIGFGQTFQSVSGTIYDAQTNSRIPGVSLRLLGENSTAVSDGNGSFTLLDVPVGRHELEISSVGYQKVLLKELLVESAKPLVLEIALKVSTNDLPEYVVKQNGNNYACFLQGVASINVEQIQRYPAAFFDPARLARVLPGVANNNDQANGLSIRGNSPDKVSWWLEGAETVNPNHLANAGTFSDLASASAGGVNMLSAQMLGSMNLLVGPYFSNFGQGTGGIMNMNLRNGATDGAHHVFQVGLLGVDLSTEGPFKKGGKASYLMNYRYSFTGLLGLAGVDFGGEKIMFQDFSAKVNLPISSEENLSFYAVLGNHENNFQKDPAEVELLDFKDTRLINYNGKINIYGANYSKRFMSNWSYKSSLAYSFLKNYRYDGINPLIERPAINVPALINDNRNSIFSFNNVLTQKTELGSIDYFVNYKRQQFELHQNGFESVEANHKSVLQPGFSVNTRVSPKTEIQYGLMASVYPDLYSTMILEPRFAIQQKLNSKNSVTLGFGRTSQFQNQTFLFNKSSLDSAKQVISSQLSLKYDAQVGNNSNFSAEVFYSTSKNNVGLEPSNASFYSSVNGVNGLLPYELNFNSKGRNYGLELSYNRFLTNGFFITANSTLFKSEFMVNEEWYSSVFDLNKIVNLVIGKEVSLKKGSLLGFSASLNYSGGLNAYAIDLERSKSANTTIFDYSVAPNVKNSDYFRPDLRVYFKRFKKSKTSMWSLDLQNFIGRENDAYKYYDPYLESIVTKKQLGLIPMLNYRLEL